MVIGTIIQKIQNVMSFRKIEEFATYTMQQLIFSANTTNNT